METRTSSWQAGGGTSARPFELDRSGVSGVCSRTNMRIELDREEEGRWLIEIPELPGVMADGDSQEVMAKVKALALRVMADGLEPATRNRGTS